MNDHQSGWISLVCVQAGSNVHADRNTYSTPSVAEGVTTRNAIRSMEKYRDCVIGRTVSTLRTSHFARSPNSASSERDFMTELSSMRRLVSVGCQFHSRDGQIWRCLEDGVPCTSRYVTAAFQPPSDQFLRIRAKI